MKSSKLFSSLTILFSLGLFLAVFSPKTYAVSYTDPTDNVNFKWVYNSDAAAHEVGDVVCWYNGSTVDDGLEISTTVSANNPLVAGVVEPSDIAAHSWGFIRTSGYASKITIAVANSASDLLCTSTTAEAAGVFAVSGSTTTTGTAATSTDLTNALGIFATALEATTSSTTCKGFIFRR